MTDEYDFRPGGSLKLKTKANRVIEGGITKKKKKSSKAKVLKQREESTAAKIDDLGEGSSSNSDRKSPSGPTSSSKTEAERRFEEAQLKRMEERVKKMASLTHKDRVHLFNEKLEALSEHHDIPKVGPG